MKEKFNQKKYEEYMKIIKSAYTEIKTITIADFENLCEEINQNFKNLPVEEAVAKNKKLVKILNTKCYMILNYFAKQFASTGLSVSHFPDALSEIYLKFIENNNTKIENGIWYKNYNNYSANMHRLVDLFLEQYVIDCKNSIIIKRTSEDSEKSKVIVYKHPPKNLNQKGIKVYKEVSFDYLDQELPDDSNDIYQYVFKDALRTIMNTVLSSLTPREKEFLSKWFGIDCNMMSMSEIAEENNLTKEQVRNVLAKALRKMRHPTRSKHIRDFLDMDQENNY